MIQPPPSHDPKEIIEEGARGLGIELDAHAVSSMLRHMGLLGEWRGRADLTALTDPRQIAVVHFLDSLTVFKVMQQGAGLAMLDIGSGGGFPGLVLKTADPSIDLTVLDRDPKKIVFLKYLARELGLDRVKFLNVRVEQLVATPPPKLFDVLVSRAVFSDFKFLERLSSLLAPAGSLVRMAGPGSLQEASELEGFHLTGLWEGLLPFSDLFRRVLRYALAG